MRAIGFSFLLGFVTFLISAANTEASCRAPQIKEGFINGVVPSNDQNLARMSCQLRDLNINGVRLWLKIPDWTSSAWLNGGTARAVKRQAAYFQARGFRVTLTVTLVALAEAKGNFSPGGIPTTASEVDSTMRNVVAYFRDSSGRSLVDAWQIMNEIGYWVYWPGTSTAYDIRDPLHYAKTIYFPTARVIRELNPTAQIVVGSTWCGSHFHAARKIRSDLLEDLALGYQGRLIPGLNQSQRQHFLPDAFDCHVYRAPAEDLLSHIEASKAEYESFAERVRLHARRMLNQGVTSWSSRVNYRPKLILSEWNCGGRHQGIPLASECLSKVFSGPRSVPTLVDESYYFILHKDGHRDSLLGNLEHIFRSSTRHLRK